MSMCNLPQEFILTRGKGGRRERGREGKRMWKWKRNGKGKWKQGKNMLLT